MMIAIVQRFAERAAFAGGFAFAEAGGDGAADRADERIRRRCAIFCLW